LAFERTGISANVMQSDLIFNDIKTEYKDTPIEFIVEALRRGGLGYYGKTFKFSSQDACIWVREYLKEIAEYNKSYYKGIKLDPRWSDDLKPDNNGNLLDPSNYKNPSMMCVLGLRDRLLREGKLPQ
jgi:hypothetical protein